MANNDESVVVLGAIPSPALTHILNEQGIKYEVRKNLFEKPVKAPMVSFKSTKEMQMLADDYQPRRNKSDRKRDRKNRWR